MKRAGPRAVWMGRLGFYSLYVRRASGLLEVNESWVCGKRTKEVRKVDGFWAAIFKFVFKVFYLIFFQKMINSTYFGVKIRIIK